MMPVSSRRYLAALASVGLAVACAPPPPPPPPPGGGIACGQQRWDIKTLSEAGVQNNVNAAPPVAVTVHDLLARRQPNPWKVNLPRQVNFDGLISPAVERTVWQLNEVTLVRFKLEPDRDIHLIVRDPDPMFNTSILNIEFPDIACSGAIVSPFRAQMQAARAALIAACGNPPKSYKNISGTATITGAGFFDKEHGAPSTIELHPALSFAGACP